MFEFTSLSAVRSISNTIRHAIAQLTVHGACIWDSTNNALNSKAKPTVHYKCYTCLPQFSHQTVLYYILICDIHCICVQSNLYMYYDCTINCPMLYN